MKWGVQPVFTGKSIFQYAESHFNNEVPKVFDTYGEAKNEAEMLKKKLNVDCQIVEIEQEEEIVNEYALLQMM